MKPRAVLGCIGSKAMNKKQLTMPALTIAEDFYSIQGEGASAGTPAVFLRLAGCNLQCAGFSYTDPATGEHLGCDSKSVWRRGRRVLLKELLERWYQLGWLEALEQGAHLVITGGEPLLQQQRLLAFIDQLDQRVPNGVYIEMETNGTMLLEDRLCQRIDQINVSPKLINSGEPRSKAVVPRVITQLARAPQAQFKFVVMEEMDVTEVVNQYVIPYSIPHQRVWLMAEGGDRHTLQQRTPHVVE